MSTDTTTTIDTDAGETAQVRAHSQSVRRMGSWTTARRFDVRASRGSVILELRSPSIEPGDIEITVDLDHAMLKLLVPEDAIVEHEDVRRVRRCGVVDWGGSPQASVGPKPGGRVIRVVGEMRSSELRINRGGVAIVAAMLTGEYLADLRRAMTENHVRSLRDMREAYREGRWTTIEDPARSA